MPRDRISLYVGPGIEINDPNELDRYDNGGWIFEKKYDGIWCLIETDKSGYIERLSTRTGAVIEEHTILGEHIGMPSARFASEFESNTDPALEAIRARGFPRLYLFDVMQLNGEDTRELSQSMRSELVTEVSQVCSELQFIQRAELKLGGFKNFFNSWMKNPNVFDPVEGGVLKRIDKPYKAQNSDGKTDFWIRVKLKRAVDMYVMGTGLTNSRAPNLTMGIWMNGRMVEVQSMSVPKGFRAKDMVGLVLECTYDRKHTSGRYRHLRYKRVRTDKTKEMTG